MRGRSSARLNSTNRSDSDGRAGPEGPLPRRPPPRHPLPNRRPRERIVAEDRRRRRRARVRAAPASNLGSIPPPVMTLTVKAVRATTTATATVTMAIPRVPRARSPPMWSVAVIPPLSRYPYLLIQSPGWKYQSRDLRRRHG